MKTSNFPFTLLSLVLCNKKILQNNLNAAFFKQDSRLSFDENSTICYLFRSEQELNVNLM
jgi:hypothetical protein